MKNANQAKAWLYLADGMLLEGLSVGASGTTGGEICFNTGMTGYQEIYTDPSYSGQIIINTVSHVGNYGIKNTEAQSDKVQFSGLVCDMFSEVQSRPDADNTLQQYLESNGIIGIAEVDTRMLVRHIRSKGAMNAVISSELNTKASLKGYLEGLPIMSNLELSSKVSTLVPYTFGQEDAKYKVAVLDLGIKRNILDCLAARGVYGTVFPAKTSFTEIAKLGADGYFVSNGPGDPASMDYAVVTIKEMLETNKPLFGICLGQQILSLANGVGTFKMHNGHRGLNHPVKNLQTGKSEITSQNHGFSIDKEQLLSYSALQLTHVNLNDATPEGFKMLDKPAFAVQYHPESAPGPHDSRYLFDEFVNLMN